MKAQLTALFWLTVRDPSEAAVALMSRPVPRNVGWMILALGIVLNALAHFTTLTLFPTPPEMNVPFLTAPFLYTTILGCGLVLLVFSFYWGGRAIGGLGRFDDVLLAIGWLQFMRFAVQLASLLLMLAMPGFALVFVLGVGLYSIWVVLNFINVIHGFNSLGKSVMLVLITMMGLTVGMTLLLSLGAATAIGMS
ncbi:MAG: YIP1 family protein [Shimia sp.]|uniref:YIP1 family protein n=1 Tax=Shimia sp. TaxID=1954381 RepID=UPI001B173299|nr:YIP1 family protein [Shimia sp.]MBO6897312.1 YIP1 family protein [Shimia sp.]